MSRASELVAWAKRHRALRGVEHSDQSVTASYHLSPNELKDVVTAEQGLALVPKWGARRAAHGGGWIFRGVSKGKLLVADIYEKRRIAEEWERESERPVLIIACSKSKEPATGTYYRGWDIYRGPLWTTYRAWAGLSYASRDAGGYRKMPSWAPEAWEGVYKYRPPMVNVWIVSAKYGLMSQFRNIKPYDKQLTEDNFSAFVKLLKSQLKSGVEDAAIPPLRSISALKSRRIYFAGPKIYAEALEAAGLNIERLGGKGLGRNAKEPPGVARIPGRWPRSLRYARAQLRRPLPPGENMSRAAEILARVARMKKQKKAAVPSRAAQLLASVAKPKSQPRRTGMPGAVALILDSIIGTMNKRARKGDPPRPSRVLSAMRKKRLSPAVNQWMEENPGLVLPVRPPKAHGATGHTHGLPAREPDPAEGTQAGAPGDHQLRDRPACEPAHRCGGV